MQSEAIVSWLFSHPLAVVELDYVETLDCRAGNAVENRPGTASVHMFEPFPLITQIHIL